MESIARTVVAASIGALVAGLSPSAIGKGVPKCEGTYKYLNACTTWEDVHRLTKGEEKTKLTLYDRNRNLRTFTVKSQHIEPFEDNKLAENEKYNRGNLCVLICNSEPVTKEGQIEMRIMGDYKRVCYNEELQDPH